MMFPDREDEDTTSNDGSNAKAKVRPMNAAADAANHTHHHPADDQSAAHTLLGQRRRRTIVESSAANSNNSNKSMASPSQQHYSTLPLVHANHVEPSGTSRRGSSSNNRNTCSSSCSSNRNNSNKQQRKYNNNLGWILQCVLVATIVSRTFWHFYWLHHRDHDHDVDAAAVQVSQQNGIIHPPEGGFLHSGLTILGAVPSGGSSSSRLLEKQQSTAAVATTTMMTAVRGSTTTNTNSNIPINLNKKKAPAAPSSPSAEHDNEASPSLVNNNNNKNNNNRAVNPWSPQDAISAPLQALQQRRRARRERTTPPPPPPNSMMMDPIQSVATAAAVQVHHPSKEVTIEIVHAAAQHENEEQQQHETLPQPSPPQQHDWQALCEAAHLSSRSRVVVTNIFSHPVGTAAALLLAQQCGVRHILGADPLFPNLRQSRLRILTQQFKLLYRNVPDFRLLVPNESAGLGRWQNGLQWFPEFRPTHVLHFESLNALGIIACPPLRRDDANDDSNNNAADDETTTATTAIDEYMSRQQQMLYHRRHSELALQQILEQSHHWSTVQPVSLLHVEHRVSSGGKAMTDDASTTDEYHHHYPQQRQGHRVLADTYHTVTGNVTLHSLELPLVYGPTVPTTQQHCASMNDSTATSATISDDSLLFVDDAMAAILQALSLTHDNPNEELLRMKVSVQADASQQQTADLHKRQDAASQFHRQFPYGTPDKKSHLDVDAAQQYRDTYGIHPTRLPCATSCGGGGTTTSTKTGTCEATVFDGHVVAASRAATRACPYAVYLVEFAADLEELYELRQPPGIGATNDLLCRLAFVSGRSPLVDRALAERLRQEKLRLLVHDDDDDDNNNNNNTTKSKTAKSSSSAITRHDALKLYNGKIKSMGWTLIWLADHDESTLTDAEFALLRMEPSRFFASSVKKAMFTESQAFAEPPDNALLRILSQIDRKAFPDHHVLERRSGVSVTRWVPKPAEKARAVALFVSDSPYQPASVSEYGHLAANVTTLPRKQIVFYKQASHFVQTGQHRPEAHIRGSPYSTFPFQWISMGLIIHDLQLEQARTLRCSWLDEHLYWGHSNRYADELSFAWIVAQRRIEQSLGLNLEDDPSWVPVLQTTAAEEDSDIEKEEMLRDVTPGGEAEVFVRIMKRSAPRPEPAAPAEESSMTQEQESSA